MRREGILLAALTICGAPLGAGCRERADRTVYSAAADPASGTIYAFEVDDARHSEVTRVIICNTALPNVCYRMSPSMLEEPEQRRAVQLILERARGERAVDEHPRSPIAAPSHYETAPGAPAIAPTP